ncbi:S8 family serine peptidase [Halorubellus litoreus]|uniref:S8 family serine peptidase n=1 Tax=Halorubellus litoreus TaxID=755308 RepID=A0ABD5VB81_9EURY
MIGDSTPDAGRRSFLKGVGVAGATAAIGGVAGADDAAERVERIVGLSDTVDVADAEATILAGDDLPEGAEIVSRNDVLNYAVVELDASASTMDVSTFESRLADNSDVKYHEDNAAKWQPMAVEPNDRLFEEMYAPQQVRAPIAWEATQGSSDVTVAVVDTGIMYDHPDLADQYGETKGRDFVTVDDAERDDDPYPPDLAQEAHGTHVSGTIAAGIGNDTGVAGMSDATLLACRALGAQGGKTADIADAVQWATDQGADLVNMSLGGGGYSETMKSAVSYAVNNGCLPICAAGNNGTEGVSYPAGYNECMAISAIDENLNLASFSQFGEKIDLAAPGVNVLSCWTQEKSEFGGKYNRISGTSMATPATTGVAALAAAANPDLSPTELRQHLKDTAVDIGLGETEQGAGRVDAAKAVGATGDDDQAPDAVARASITDPHEGERVTFLGSDSSDAAGYVSEWSWDLGDGTTATGEKVVHEYDSAGDYTVTLTVTDDDGATATDSVDVTVQPGTCAEGPVKTDSFSGTVSPTAEQRDISRHDYSWQTTEPCELELSFTYPEGRKYTGFVIQGSGSDRDVFTGESITLLSSDIDSSKALQVGVLAQKGADEADYSIDVEEHGFAQEGGEEPEPNEPPTAKLSLSNGSVQTGQELSVDASTSSDTDGSIDSYEWTFGDGATASGKTATHAYTDAGEYTVTVTVTDDDGASDDAQSTVTVTEPNQGPTASVVADADDAPVGSDVTFDASGSSDADGTIETYEWSVDGAFVTEGTEPMFTYAFEDAGEHTVSVTVVDDDGASASDDVTVQVDETGGSCGDETATDSVGGLLRGWWDEDSYTYTTETGDPCRVTLTLSGRGRGSDFDLYVTTDGRTPTTYDYDLRSITPRSDEQITVEDVDGDLGVLVDSYSGGGRYTLDVEELGN